MFCNRSYDAGHGGRLPRASRSVLSLGPQGQLLPAALLCLSWALLPAGPQPLSPQELRLGAGFCLLPSSEAAALSVPLIRLCSLLGQHLQHLGGSGCFLPFGEAAAHISGCLLAGCAPGIQTLPQHFVSTPASHCPQPELGQVQLRSLRVLQHPAKDRTFRDTYRKFPCSPCLKTCPSKEFILYP